MHLATSRLTAIASALVGLLGFAGSSHATTTTYEVGADWSNTQNGGSNPWSYGYVSNGQLYSAPNTFNSADYTLFTYNSGNQWLIQNQSDPNVFHNPGASTGAGTNFYAAHNAVILGPFQGPTVVQWTAPFSGTADLTSSGQDIQACCGPRSVYYDVFINNSDVLTGGPQNVGPNPSGSVDPNHLPTATYDVSNLPVVAGETITFVAWNHGGDDNNSMQLNATIALTPEPSSLAVLGLAAAGVLARRRHIA